MYLGSLTSKRLGERNQAHFRRRVVGLTKVSVDSSGRSGLCEGNEVSSAILGVEVRKRDNEP